MKRPATFTRLASHEKRLTLLVASLVGILLVLFIQVVFGSNAQAIQTQWEKDYGDGNEVEKTYVNDNYSAGVWVSAPGSRYTTTGIDVREGQDSMPIPVVIRGSWSPKRDRTVITNSSFRGVYANLRTTGCYPVAGQNSNGGCTNIVYSRLSLSGRYFYRGDRPPSNGYRDVWYTRNIDTSQPGSQENGELHARLNVSGWCTGNYGRTITKSVYIASRFTVKTANGGKEERGDINYDETSIRVKCIPTSWTSSGSTSINRTNANVGQTVTWNHSVRNNGPADTGSNVRVTIDRYYADMDGNRIGSISNPHNRTGVQIDNGERYNMPSTSYRMTAADVGRQICERVAWTPSGSASGSGWKRSTQRCATVPTRYEAYPNINASASVAQPGGSVGVRGSVYNVGNNSANVRYSVGRVVLDRDQVGEFNDSFNRTMSSSPNWRYGQGNISGEEFSVCQWLNLPGDYDCDDASRNGSVTAQQGRSTQAFSASLDIPSSVSYGEVVCFVMAINNVSTSAAENTRRYAGTECLVVSKSPLVQVWGGGLSVGKTFSGGLNSDSRVVTSLTQAPRSETNQSVAVFGSWAEYGIYAPNSITNMASASGLNRNTETSMAMSSWSDLTYTNTGMNAVCDGGYGCYNTANRLPDPSGSFLVTSDTPRVSSVNVSSRQGVVTNSGGSISIGGGTVPSGRWIVVNAPSATVTITGNIEYDNGPYSNVGQIPQLIIIANTINIRHGVEQVDAWLVAKSDNALQGVVNTCSTRNSGSALAPTAALSGEMCEQQLTVNGPIIANRLFLRRTHGAQEDSSNGRGTPAEIINLRPDAYLWARQHMTSDSVLRTTSLAERPPRF